MIKEEFSLIDLGPRGRPQFRVGQLVSHQLLGYRGVIVDVHHRYQGSEEWYERVATERPPKDAPWYEVLVHDSTRVTYVSEQNLDIDITGMPIQHPMLRMFFNEFHSGHYRVAGPSN